jgi:hypothetical protein
VSAGVPAAGELLEAASLYARLGWPVIPLHVPREGRCSCPTPDCAQAGKHPRIRAWARRATVDPAIVDGWAREFGAINIGIVTGHASGTVVVDIDDRRRGDDSIAELEAEHGALPATVEAVTGGGGRHLVFAHRRGEPPVRSSAGSVATGIDVRADGGLIVVSPSLHRSGRRYEWELSAHPTFTPLAEPPDWLLALIRGAPERRARPPSHGRPIPRGRRNDTLIALAGHLVKLGLSGRALAAALEAENERCRPRLPRAEIATMVRSSRTWDAPPPWTIDPFGFLQDPRLRATERMVLLAITTHARADGTCFPGLRRLARLTGVTPDTVSRAVGRLEEVGRLEVERPLAGRRAPNRYRVLPFDGAPPDDRPTSGT